jgi:hypothetical protein
MLRTGGLLPASKQHTRPHDSDFLVVDGLSFRLQANAYEVFNFSARNLIPAGVGSP